MSRDPAPLFTATYDLCAWLLGALHQRRSAVATELCRLTTALFDQVSDGLHFYYAAVQNWRYTPKIESANPSPKLRASKSKSPSKSPSKSTQHDTSPRKARRLPSLDQLRRLGLREG